MEKYRIKSNWELHTNQIQQPYIAGADFNMRWDEDLSTDVTNFQQLYVNHSPTGMSWGYGGSGPSDCAFNILLNAVSGGTGLVTEDEEDIIRASYMDFKVNHIATLPEKGGVINYSTVVDYLKSRGWEAR